MSTQRYRWAALVVVPLLVGACGSGSEPGARTAPDEAPATSPTPTATLPASPSATAGDGTSGADSMPDLVGLGAAEAGRRIGELGLGGDWRTVVVRCGVRPGTVAQQSPAPGTALADETQVRVGVARLDLDEFRGPCEAADLEPGAPADHAIARRLYRFAADPSLGAPFVDGSVWTGIEDGVIAVRVRPGDRADLAAWRMEGEYAERGGPFSALDLLAASGGYYELHRGVAGTCPAGDGQAPREMAGLRAISLTAPGDTVGSCLDWWGVTLFLEHDEIAGVALRIGSP